MFKVTRAVQDTEMSNSNDSNRPKATKDPKDRERVAKMTFFYVLILHMVPRKVAAILFSWYGGALPFIV